MRILTKCVLALAVSLLPATVFAQATLTGTVRDASGAVSPGVTVESSSSVLIEKERARSSTDDTGQYRFVDPRPGTYSVTFTLPGFTTVKRDNIELAGTQTITIPVEMRVGVSEDDYRDGRTPVVDVQSAAPVVMSAEVIASLPVARAAGALFDVTPGLPGRHQRLRLCRRR